MSQNNQLIVVETPIADVIPYARNPRKNSKAIDKVAASLKEYGWRQPIVVDKDNVIVVGHTRLEAARKLKMTHVPVHKAENLTEQQVKAYRLADNRTNQDAEWDWALLGLELKDIGDLYSGFDKDEISKAKRIAEEKQPRTGEDDMPIITEPRAKAGDVWVCGNHRVICGDSLDPNVYKRLMGNDLADLMWTDPPYNVAYQSAGERTGYASYGKDLHKKIANDDMSDSQFLEFLTKAFKCAYDVARKGAVYYVSFSDKEGINFRLAIQAAGWNLKQTIIWVKNTGVLSRQDYNWQHEPILYGWKEGAGHYFAGDFTLTTVMDYRNHIKLEELHRDQLLEIVKSIGLYTDIIDCNKPPVADLHPTMKPVDLIKKNIEASTKEDNIVLDMFGGSGSTLIACENTGRRARLIELDPHYVDVIVKRWEEHTGQVASLEK